MLPTDEAWTAICRGDDRGLGRLLAAHPAMATAVFDREDWPAATLLHHAVWWRRHGCVRRLLDSGARPNVVGGRPPRTSRGLALEYGQREMATAMGAPADFMVAAALGDHHQRRVFWSCFPTRYDTAARRRRSRPEVLELLLDEIDAHWSG